MAVLAEAPRRGAPSAGHAAAGHRDQRLFEPGGTSLEDSILRAWEELACAGRAECPVCGAELHAAGPCGGCGSELS